MVKIATMADHRDKQHPRLGLTRLDLTDFRNYPGLRLDLGKAASPLIVLTGENGAGKTNLLEAVSYLGPDRGLRGARLQDVTRKTAKAGWAVSGLLDRAGETLRLGCGIEVSEDAATGGARRVVVCEGEKLSGASALAHYLTVIWLTPKMDRIFQDGASERRRFFDQLATGLFPDHAGQTAAFEKAMRERLKLITEARSTPDEAWLSALERRMAEHAVAVAATRLEVLALVRSHMEFSSDRDFPLPDLGLEGEVEELVSGMSALEAEEAFAALLKNNRRADREAGRTLKGPHKTDLLALHPDKGLIAGQCSTGEQKAMLIGILLAAVRLQVSIKERAPVVLLDEVVAHLDIDRRKALFRELQTLRVQTWMTGTDQKLFAPLKGEAVFFTVQNGALKKS